MGFDYTGHPCHNGGKAGEIGQNIGIQSPSTIL